MARNLAGRGNFTGSDLIPNSTLDDPWSSERQSFTCSGWTGNCVGQPSCWANVNSRRTPYVGQWLMNVQRQVGDGLALEIGYMGNLGRKLEWLRARTRHTCARGRTTTVAYSRAGRFRCTASSSRWMAS